MQSLDLTLDVKDLKEGQLIKELKDLDCSNEIIDSEEECEARFERKFEDECLKEKQQSHTHQNNDSNDAETEVGLEKKQNEEEEEISENISDENEEIDQIQDMDSLQIVQEWDLSFTEDYIAQILDKVHENLNDNQLYLSDQDTPFFNQRELEEEDEIESLNAEEFECESLEMKEPEIQEPDQPQPYEEKRDLDSTSEQFVIEMKELQQDKLGANAIKKNCGFEKIEGIVKEIEFEESEQSTDSGLCSSDPIILPPQPSLPEDEEELNDEESEKQENNEEEEEEKEEKEIIWKKDKNESLALRDAIDAHFNPDSIEEKEESKDREDREDREDAEEIKNLVENDLENAKKEKKYEKRKKLHEDKLRDHLLQMRENLTELMDCLLKEKGNSRNPITSTSSQEKDKSEFEEEKDLSVFKNYHKKHLNLFHTLAKYAKYSKNNPRFHHSHSKSTNSANKEELADQLDQQQKFLQANNISPSKNSDSKKLSKKISR